MEFRSGDSSGFWRWILELSIKEMMSNTVKLSRVRRATLMEYYVGCTLQQRPNAKTMTPRQVSSRVLRNLWFSVASTSTRKVILCNILPIVWVDIDPPALGGNQLQMSLDVEKRSCIVSW
ncbi:hypothetical protein TNCV_1071341 [Trichonephila clavipes]|nr:hypothetical protein TNCV_1071341 [Trichonephila clavipes]